MNKKADGQEVNNLIETCACFWTRAAARRLTRDYDEALKPIGLKITQFSILAIIRNVQPKSITDMSAIMAMERTSLVRTLTLLEKKGYIKMGPEGYRREREMSLTNKGKKILERAIPLWNEAQNKFKARLGSTIWEENIPLMRDAAFGSLKKKANRS